MTDPYTPPVAPPKPRRGCFFYGCITGVILAVIVLVGAIAGYMALKKKINTLVQNYTDTQPMKLPTVTMSQEEMAKVKKRYDDFEQAVRNGKPTEPLVLDSDEINALILNSPDAKSFKGKLYVTLDGDKARGEVSLPLDDLAKSPVLKMVKGRYLNGSCTFNVSLRSGQLFIAPDAITVKGNPLPETFMAAIRNQNFAAGTTNDPNAMAVLNKLQDIEIKDSKLTVVPKETKDVPAEAAPK